MSSSHFDSIAAVYDESIPAHVVEHYLKKRTAFVVAHCPRGEGLDVGCGTGVLAERLAGAGYEMVGVDPSEGMLEILEARTPLVRPVHASGTSLPFDDDSFDLVDHRRRHAPHRRPRRRTSDARRDGQGRQGRRSGGRVGPQPPQPVLGAADGPRPPGHRRGATNSAKPRSSPACAPRADGSCRARSSAPSRTSPRPGRSASPRRWSEPSRATPGLRRFAAHNVILATK